VGVAATGVVVVGAVGRGVALLLLADVGGVSVPAGVHPARQSIRATESATGTREEVNISHILEPAEAPCIVPDHLDIVTAFLSPYRCAQRAAVVR
jgi:hypothetical protein